MRQTASEERETMKSNEEFIAGIYEKAATYTEEKKIKVIKTNWAARTTKVAAMVAVCIGLAGVGSLVFGDGKKQVPTETPAPTDNYGIALTSEDGEESGEVIDGASQFRIGPVIETVTFTGVVEHVDIEEKRIWLRLTFDETAPEYAEGSVVCIKWDMLEKISEEIVTGTGLTATGTLSVYENPESEQNGCAELVLTDVADIEIK